jgi:hypothetical protein
VLLLGRRWALNAVLLTCRFARSASFRKCLKPPQVRIPIVMQYATLTKRSSSSSMARSRTTLGVFYTLDFVSYINPACIATGYHPTGRNLYYPGYSPHQSCLLRTIELWRVATAGYTYHPYRKRQGSVHRAHRKIPYAHLPSCGRKSVAERVISSTNLFRKQFGAARVPSRIGQRNEARFILRVQHAQRAEGASEDCGVDDDARVGDCKDFFLTIILMHC